MLHTVDMSEKMLKLPCHIECTLCAVPLVQDLNLTIKKICSRSVTINKYINCTCRICKEEEQTQAHKTQKQKDHCIYDAFG